MIFQLRNCNTVMPRAVGISGIEKRLAENHHRTHESISQVLLIIRVMKSDCDIFLVQAK